MEDVCCKVFRKVTEVNNMNNKRSVKEDIMWELAYISTKMEDLLDTDLYSVAEDIERLRGRFDIVAERIDKELVEK